ncbi:MAG: hypothetical protein QGG34_03780 [SAR202 cluster bacterium]|jgi:hypothetical protein|nr:hypothetical protein [SAR202 cluster bacterium]|tara:strand:+ start:5277 stop:5717 length:441 start_codon:yes stop_codon:yes gene_type:complete
MFTFATDYSICVFIATVGVLQIAVSIGRIDGLLFFKRPVLARALGVVLVVFAFVLFFSTGPRNVNDFEGGMDANGQALFFFYGSFLAVIVTFAVSSIVNIAMKGREAPVGAGLDAVRDTNYVVALTRSLTYWWRNWRTQMKSYFFG